MRFKENDIVRTKDNVTIRSLEFIGIDDDMTGIDLIVRFEFNDGWVSVYSEEARDGVDCSIPGHYLKLKDNDSY